MNRRLFLLVFPALIIGCAADKPIDPSLYTATVEVQGMT
jgi:hypothetical protein